MMQFEVKYELGHSRNETWDKFDLFCPICGKQQVWGEDSSGDYYEGSDYMCAACGVVFTMPTCRAQTQPGQHPDNWQDRQRFERLKEGETHP